ncbi:MAG: ATP-binding cassette domain-containing protein [Planctomycetaceae bacterium]|nr:ATP-binding cassette domain-containing protein [Planctomycetaceae bacterium]
MDKYILEMKGITKTFPSVKALSDVNLSVRPGTIHALVGENGAGKSTLINIISGVYPHGTYEGSYQFNGREMRFRQIREVEREGIACIHQELNLAPELSVAENIFLNEKPTKYGFVDFDAMHFRSKQVLEKIGINTDPTAGGISPEEKVSQLGIGRKQIVEIAKALVKDVKLLLLDEPTAALTEAEVDVLLDILDGLRKSGIAMIYISHRLDEVMRIADDITVLRDGQTVETRARKDMDKDTMISLMVGRELTNLFPKEQHTRGELALEIRNYTVPNPDVPGQNLIENVNLKAYRGEILGISGLMGAGRTELFTAIFGAFRTKGRGEVLIDGEPVTIREPREALERGFVIISEDRKKFGLNLMMSIKENTTMASLRKVSSRYILDQNREVKYTQDYIRDIQIAAPSIDTLVKNLSGGNQQKVVLAKALFCDPRIMILDEPTRGIDVGAKYEIYKIMNQLVDQGVAIIMISSEMEEILGMSDRIVTMSNGRITGEFDGAEATQEILMKASVIGRDEE